MLVRIPKSFCLSREENGRERRSVSHHQFCAFCAFCVWRFSCLSLRGGARCCGHCWPAVAAHTRFRVRVAVPEHYHHMIWHVSFLSLFLSFSLFVFLSFSRSVKSKFKIQNLKIKIQILSQSVSQSVRSHFTSQPIDPFTPLFPQHCPASFLPDQIAPSPIPAQRGK